MIKIMKKAAILIYNQFCNFEIALLLEIFKFNNKPITIFSKSLEPVLSEEGIRILPDKEIVELELEEYDSLILTGAEDIREVIEDKEIIDFIKKFEGLIIGAISIAPVILLKADLLKNKRFMAGVNQEELYEEGFAPKELKLMIGWEDSKKESIKYIVDNNIITSVSYNFIYWSVAVARELGLKAYFEDFIRP